MKALINHFVQNNWDQIVEKSLLNCHVVGMHSIMLFDTPEQKIRMFITTGEHELWQNDPKYHTTLSLAYHPHHCNITIQCIEGKLTNVIVMESNLGRQYAKFKYVSGILEDKIGFQRIGVTGLAAISRIEMHPGCSVYMPAEEIHTVHVPRGELAAWVVIEGKEDEKYESISYSDTDLSKEDFSQLYKKPTEGQLRSLLKRVL